MAPLLDDNMHTTLLDLLSNTLVLRQTTPYLPISALYALAATSTSFHYLVHHSPEVFRYLDLSTVKSTFVPYVPLDSGGNNWRSERMDEALSEDEFYSGPLRGIFSKLGRGGLLRNVHTLVLDGLSVPADLVREIIMEDRFNVRILSIREVENLNEKKLIQYLKYAVRPTRAKNTPRLKGLYYFGPREPLPVEHIPIKKKKSPPGGPQGVKSSHGAQISAQWNQRSSEALTTVLTRTEDKWYQPSGRITIKRPHAEWPETLQACEGIIFFDAVLCRGPRHDVQTAYINDGQNAGVPHPFSCLKPAVATIALGPSGCNSCHSVQEGAAYFGQSPAAHLPLLSPPPLHSASIRAAQIPSTTDGSATLPLIIRCEDCLRGRWCERCNKWWDEPCYAGSAVASRTELQQTEYMEQVNGALEFRQQKEIKVHMGLCIDQCLVRK